MKPEYFPSVIVACVGLLTAGWVFPQTWLGVASGVILVFTCILAYIVKPKVERVFDGSNIDEVANLVAEKIGLKK